MKQSYLLKLYIGDVNNETIIYFVGSENQIWIELDGLIISVKGSFWVCGWKAKGTLGF